MTDIDKILEEPEFEPVAWRDKENGMIFILLPKFMRELRQPLLTIDQLHALAERVRSEYKDKYEELIYAVARKYPDETRHETALRYIRQKESGDPIMCKACGNKEEFIYLSASDCAMAKGE